jgi:hypothetical protein
MIREIEIDNYPNQDYSVTLDQQGVVINLKMNIDRNGDPYWMMSLSAIGGRILSAGRRIKSGYPILPETIFGFQGNFIALPISSPEVPLGLEPWGSTHLLQFYHFEE